MTQEDIGCHKFVFVGIYCWKTLIRAPPVGFKYLRVLFTSVWVNGA